VSEPKLHSVLSKPHEYELTEFYYHVEKEDPGQSFIDITLRKNNESVKLKFWQPTNLRIEEGFPQPTCGMVFYDISANGLENIGVEVADFEASWGSVTFFAKSVEKIS
jgi:hypothetical protein